MVATSSLNQGLNFQKITAKYHGGKRKTKSKNKMAKKSGSTRRMRGGASSFFTPYSDYPTSMNTMLPNEIRELARIAPLDAKIAELPAIQRAATMTGGSRHSRHSRHSRRIRRRHGGSSPINAPSMLLGSAEEEAAARLNPQWYTENTVVPNFRGPIPYPGGTVPAPTKGGRRTRRRITMRR